MAKTSRSNEVHSSAPAAYDPWPAHYAERPEWYTEAGGRHLWRCAHGSCLMPGSIVTGPLPERAENGIPRTRWDHLCTWHYIARQDERIQGNMDALLDWCEAHRLRFIEVAARLEGHTTSQTIALPREATAGDQAKGRAWILREIPGTPLALRLAALRAP